MITFTAEQLRKAAEPMLDVGPHYDQVYYDRLAAMLTQAANDVDDAQRWRAFRHAAANMDLTVLATLERHIPDGDATPAELEIAIDEAIDAARKELGS
jgi:putative hemolysin